MSMVDETVLPQNGRAVGVGPLTDAPVKDKPVGRTTFALRALLISDKDVDFSRDQLSERGLDLMNNWLTAGAAIDAVAANNDEMAIGAIMAIHQAHVAPGKILVGGVDATPDALAEVAKGTLAVTVFQNARGQARGALDAAMKLSRKEPVDSFVSIPFELVTRENYKAFLGR